MIDWTDRNCRFFHRLMTRHARLFTEMVVDEAILHGNRQKLLGFDPAEHPLVLQLGGSNPAKLAEAARIAEQFGYDEINLNVGCPSDRVQSGTFGACLMLQPELVGECVAAMHNAVAVPVTVKCRIGVDDQDPEPALDNLADAVFDAGSAGIWVHARKAWLKGLSPKENREIPPLDYTRVTRLKQRYPARFVGINGGIANVAAAQPHLQHLDGVMLGRAAYHDPADLLNVDPLLFGRKAPVAGLADVVMQMADYAAHHIANGGKLGQVTRHMLGLFNGRPGARQWRQILSQAAYAPGASPALLLEAMAKVQFAGNEASIGENEPVAAELD
ncbi:tRNA dihydrouridine(20/20a) synthase DusA [Aureimonas fodinaquatilis]|uniref:tRNA-dihydrouridine(20/20a) synthase n=2 Tax=Aureimonas fodinaquatilis TaxID=2565783 RepID=A0A5B0DV12_9HYPH|nr:tRNA dihydrouridine(20/20a) synthase DusA [Aureimonas fodinaquatilis]